jgi:autotransporter-like protein
LKKQILALSAAVLSLVFAAPALADDWTDITTELHVPVSTALAANGQAGDIEVDNNGGIALTATGGGPIVTINSNNSFDQLSGTTISYIGVADATGILVDLTQGNLDATNDGGTCTENCHTIEGIVEAGTIDLSGAGIDKKGLWLQGNATGGTQTMPNIFTGNIDMTGSTMTITGDDSVGVQIDALAQLNGNLTLGSMTLKPSTVDSTNGITGVDLEGVVDGDITVAGAMVLAGSNKAGTDTGIWGLKLNGPVNGNVSIDSSTGSITAYGVGAVGVLLTGSINACDAVAIPGCASMGSFINNGAITVAGQQNLTGDTGQLEASSAVEIGGNVAAGIYNAGPVSPDDKTLAATISEQGDAPGFIVSTQFEAVDTNGKAPPITIGVYQTAPGVGDPVDPGFSMYNRGSIFVAPANKNETASGVEFVGLASDENVELTGGFLNSGTISASAASITKGSATVATALTVGNFAALGDQTTGDEEYHYDPNCDCFDGYGNSGSKPFAQDQAALVNSNEAGSGHIVATVSGPMGGVATAIDIEANGYMPSLINSGLISAVATTTDTTISNLAAFAIVDKSGTLTYIQNNGTIDGVTTTLDNGDQVAVAIDLHADTLSSAAGSGVDILDHSNTDTSASIVGDILFGTGDHQIVDVLGQSSDHLATIVGDINFGAGGLVGSDELNIGQFSTVTGTITSDPTVGVSVDIENGGTLVITNNAKALNAFDFHVANQGTLDLTVYNNFTSGIIVASGVDANNNSASITFDPGAKLNITYGSFIPASSTFILMTAPHDNLLIDAGDLIAYNAQLAANMPFLFSNAQLNTTTSTDGTTDELVLAVTVKDAKDLGLTGYAKQIFTFANQALTNDNLLGAAIVNGVTSQAAAQKAYNSFAPDLTGGARAIAQSLTDQASGPVAARQRLLRMYGKAEGETTLWGQEFAEFVQDPGDRSTGQSGFKDHGFGFVLGLDGGDPKMGWYGGAFSFYSGDIVEPAPRDSHTDSLWYMLTGYTDWRGKGLFLDTKVDVGYMTFKEKRFITLTIPNASGTGSSSFVDEADSSRPGLVGSAGFTTGVILSYGSTTLTPQMSVDGMTMREEGFTESHVGSSTTNGNGKGFDLTEQAYYANSLRMFMGADVRQDLDFGDFFVQPDVRLGYRYDFLNDPTRLKLNFADVGNLSTPTPGPEFTLQGPDPSQGNVVAGASLSATTDAWTIGANFDFVRGDNGATTEVGTIHLLGRI